MTEGTTGDRARLFEADIKASPEAMTRLLDAWRRPDLGGRSRFAITGLGSSRYAALVVAASLRAAGRNAWTEHASTGSPTAPAGDLVLIAISASGRTSEVIDSAERHRGRSLVVAVTNDPVSRLASVADIVVPLEAGEETAGIACRTFRATVASVAMLTGASTDADLRPAIDAIASRIETCSAWMPPLADVLDGAASMDVLADASLIGLAEQAALMLREAPRLPAHAWDSGDWLHTGVYLSLPGHRALLFPGAAADADVIATIRRRGGEVAIVPPMQDPPDRAIERTIFDSVVAELIAADLWGRATGYDKGP
jgi:glutamine---fructose-6-phosphate transaminase (isomerizing)